MTGAKANAWCDWRRDLRAFGAGLGCGLFGGAVLVLVLLTQYHLISWPRENRNAAVRTTDDPGAAVLAPSERPSGTSGRTPESRSRGAVIGPEPSSPGELAGRDLLIPVEGVKADQLTRQFDDTRGGLRRHEALDILAPRITPVRAVEGGTIARLFYSKAGGTTIYQFDPSGMFCYYYAHLERYADGLREGQAVGKGQLLGYVGTSGNAPKDSPHLHFAIFRLTEAKHWWEGTPIDPYDVLR
jgi:peptidoglycan LD-endopeptidase LytH